MQWRTVGLVSVVGMTVVMAVSRVEAKEKASPAAPPPAAEPVGPSPKELAEKELAEQGWRKKLEGEWTLTLVPSGQAQASAQTDTLTFGPRQISSAMLVAEGYPTSNYTLTVREDNQPPIWETMQKADGSDAMAFWRAEVYDDVMRGVLSKQAPDGISQTYAFSGRRAGAAAPPAEGPAVSGAVAPVADPTAPPMAGSSIGRAAGSATTTPEAEPAPAPKKRKGWFGQ